MSYGVDTDANALYTSLTAGLDVTIPVLDLTDPKFEIPGDTDSDAYKAIAKLTNADLTTGNVDGAGTFDVLMQGMKSQLLREFEKGRISSAEYTKAYVALTQSTMQFAVQYLLGRDQAYWQSVTAQAQAVTARVQLEQAKLQAAVVLLEAQTSKATLALTKAKLGTEDVQFGQLKYQVDNLLPAQLSQVTTQTQVTAKQIALVTEQTEAQRAQTLDNRTDGSVVTGVLGKQKGLYAQQVVSYQRDAEVKAAKIFSDAWITQKTIDEGLTAPSGFTNASLDTVLSAIKTNNGLN
jgi:hypothetical protein